MKTYKDEKYIYLLMAYQQAQGKKNGIVIGKDNGYKDGYHYERRFKIHNYKDKILLIETKSSISCADFSRIFEVLDYGTGKITFRDYINESGENGATKWTH